VSAHRYAPVGLRVGGPSFVAASFVAASFVAAAVLVTLGI